MQFDEAVSYLLSLGHETVAIKLGLKNTEVLLQHLGNPHRSYESIQIAGTNGKGSTAVMLASICRSAGIRAGLYTSPHLVSPTERIIIDGQQISRETFARLVTRVRDVAQTLVMRGDVAALPSFFEQVTAVALLAFEEVRVEVAILETGMGGRLDATTVAGASIVAITPISLDHQPYLGKTIEEIAFEKAAIIRTGVTAVVSEQPAAALEVIDRRATDCGVRPHVIDWTTTVKDSTKDGRFRVTFETPHAVYEEVLLGMRGRHQVINAGVAVRVAEILRQQGFALSQEAIVEGLGSAHHGGRLELLPGEPAVLLDGAHNQAGARALREYLDEFATNGLTLVFGAMRDKQLGEIAAILFPKVDQLILTPVENPRSASVTELELLARDVMGNRPVYTTESAAEAFQKARKITPAEAMICVTGSLYLVGEIKAAITSERLSIGADNSFRAKENSA